MSLRRRQDRERDVNYDEFKTAFVASLKDSGLPIISDGAVEEILNLRSMDRICTAHVEPVGRQIGAPFHVTGSISWRWGTLQTARTATTEEDLLTELLGREGDRTSRRNRTPLDA